MNNINNNLKDKYLEAISNDPNLENNTLPEGYLTIEDIIKHFDNIINTSVTTYGRVINYRNSKMFIIIRYKTYDLQCLVNEEHLAQIKQLIVIGDIIKIEGLINYSNTSAQTIFAKNISFLAKCTRHIPDQYYIENKNNKYQNTDRTVYLAFHKPAFELIQIRFDIIKQIRLFMYNRAFYEADTPALCKIAGGATAKPFETNYLVHKAKFNLRIAPELYLKRLIIAGFPKIFEICHNFRNEGTSIVHNPEFTMLEVYEINITLSDVINRAIQLIKHLVNYINRVYNKNIEINFDNIQRAKFFDVLSSIVPNYQDLTLSELMQTAQGLDIVYTDENIHEITKEGIYDDIVSKYFIGKKHNKDIFIITHHPESLSPLSKILDPGVAMRFEIYVNGNEVVDGYEENNNFEKQLHIFQEQEKTNQRPSDYSFCDDLSIGMPQTCGYGMGIDRFIKTMLELPNIRDAIPFIE